MVLDEFDRCESAEFRRTVAEFLKNLSDRSVRVQLVIAGVAGNLEELIEPGAMIQRNVVAVEVPGMTPAELGDLVRNGQAVSGITFDDEALRMVISAANGLPYLASLLSQHAETAALLIGRPWSAGRTMRSAIEQALAEHEGTRLAPGAGRDRPQRARREWCADARPLSRTWPTARRPRSAEADIGASTSTEEQRSWGGRHALVCWT